MLVTAVGGQLLHLIGPLTGQRYFCSVVKRKIEKGKSLRFTSSNPCSIDFSGWDARSTLTHRSSIKVINLDLQTTTDGLLGKGTEDEKLVLLSGKSSVKSQTQLDIFLLYNSCHSAAPTSFLLALFAQGIR